MNAATEVAHFIAKRAARELAHPLPQPDPPRIPLPALTNAEQDLAKDFMEFYPVVYYTALSRTHNSHDAEDLTQETFTRALIRIASREPIPNPRAWLLSTLRMNILTAYWATRTRAGGGSAPRFVPNVCPVCDSMLEVRNCKMMCGSCGYHARCGVGGKQ